MYLPVSRLVFLLFYIFIFCVDVGYFFLSGSPSSVPLFYPLQSIRSGVISSLTSLPLPNRTKREKNRFGKFCTPGKYE